MKQASFKRFTIFFDQHLFISITLLSVMGLFFLYSASQGNINVVMKQAIFVGFGIFLMFILSQPDPDIYKILSLVFLVTSLLLVLITILFLARTMYSEHNLKKVIGACVLAKAQTSSIEEAKQICADKFKK